MAFVAHSDATGSSEFFCSGTVLSPNVVLTAGHCATDEATGRVRDPSGFLAVTGAVDWTDNPVTVSRVAKVIVDPAYDPTAGTSDAALLVLSTVTTAPPIRLATSADQNRQDPGTGALIAGWGLTSGGSSITPNGFMWASTVVQSAPYCSQASGYPYSYRRRAQLCAVNYPTYDTASCHGDSGGALVASDPSGRPVEIGISAITTACNTLTPDLFTTVAPLSAWANSWVRAAASPPPFTPPASTPPASPPPSTPPASPPPSTPPASLPPSTSPAVTSPPSLQPPSTPQLPFMTLSQAGEDTRQAVRGAFSAETRHWHAYTASCSRRSAIRVTCAVSFSSGRNDYYGQVVVYFFRGSGANVYWTDDYSMHWVNDQCYSHSGHRRSCTIHGKRGTW